jgi:hypothetical protein
MPTSKLNNRCLQTLSSSTSSSSSEGHGGSRSKKSGNVSRKMNKIPSISRMPKTSLIATQPSEDATVHVSNRERDTVQRRKDRLSSTKVETALEQAPDAKAKYESTPPLVKTGKMSPMRDQIGNPRLRMPKTSLIMIKPSEDATVHVSNRERDTVQRRKDRLSSTRVETAPEQAPDAKAKYESTPSLVKTRETSPMRDQIVIPSLRMPKKSLIVMQPSQDVTVHASNRKSDTVKRREDPLYLDNLSLNSSSSSDSEEDSVNVDWSAGFIRPQLYKNRTVKKFTTLSSISDKSEVDDNRSLFGSDSIDRMLRSITGGR